MPLRTPKRMLAAVMFTDMVGYTRLMEQDEQRAIILRKRHRETLSHWHQIYEGEILQYFGDGTLSIFQSTGNAVKCAIAIQIDLQISPKVPLRIGIHSGEIVRDQEDIIGSTVNIASRIESFANIGGVLVSKKIRHELRNQKDLTFQSLGKYTLKNVEHPMEIFAVANDGVKVPQSSDLQGKGMPLKMKMPEFPSRLSNFIGRKKDIITLENLIKKSRLLTIIGPGGIGKTRLSLQILSSITSYFKDGTVFVSLTSVHDPGYVIQEIFHTLGIKKESGSGLFDTLVSFLSNKHILLILDNFEQIISARHQISKLLRCCKNLKLLITSREALQIEGEQLYPLSPFTLPEDNYSRPIKDWLKYECIQFFVQRAKAARPDFQLNEENAPSIAEICVRLDGLPLAIELAASRIRLISPRAMLNRLQNRFSLLSNKSADLPERHQTIWNTILWSYEMLDQEDQKLLRFLSVFVGGCTLQDLEELWSEVCTSDQFILDNVTSLFNKSLVFQEEDPDGEPRIMLLESIRQFGLHQSSQEETQQYYQVYSDHFVSIVTKAKENLAGSDQQQWLSLLEKENNNLRAIYDWLVIQENDQQVGISFVMGLYRFWLIRSPSEGIEKIDQIIKKLEPSAEPRAELAQLYSYAATLVQSPGLYLKASKYYERSLGIYRQLNDRHGIAVTLNHLGWMGWRLGDFEVTKQRSLEGLELHKALQNPAGVATSLNNLGAAAQNQGYFQLAKEYHSEALTIRKHFSDQRAIAFSKLGLGQALSYCCEFSKAEQTLNQALEVFESLTDNSLLGYTTNVLADLKYLENKLEEAQQFVEGKALPIVRWLGSSFGQGFALRVLGDIHLAKEDNQLSEKYHQESYEHRKKSNDIWCMAQSLHRLALVAVSNGHYTLAQKRLKNSLNLRLRMKDRYGILECLEFYLFLAYQKEKVDLAAELDHTINHFRNKYQYPTAPVEKKRFTTIGKLFKENLKDYPISYEQDPTLKLKEIWDVALFVDEKFSKLLFN